MDKNLPTKPKRKLLPRVLGICALIGAYAAADAIVLGAMTTPAEAWGGGHGGWGGGRGGWGGRGWGGGGWGYRRAWGGGGWGYRRGWGGGWGPGWGWGGGWGPGWGGGGCWWWNGWTWVSRCW
jgi:hypothetical protein